MPQYRNTQHASQAYRDYQAALTAARAFTDPNLSPAGVQARRNEMVQEAEDQIRAKRHSIAETAKTVAEQAKASAAKLRPTITDRAEVAARWEQLRYRLDGGAAIGELMGQTDTAGMLALLDYGPSYLAGRLGADTDENVDVARMFDDRLIAMGGDIGNALTAEREAGADLAKVTVWNNAVPGQSELHLAVGAQHAE